MKKFIFFLCTILFLMTGIIKTADAKPSNCPYDLKKLSIHYSNMSSAKRKLFDDLYDAIRRQDASVPVSNLKTDEVYLVLDTIFNECPELCSLGEWVVWGHDIGGTWTPTEVKLTYKRTIREQDAFINEVAGLARQFKDVNAIYKYLCRNLSYGDSDRHPEHMYAYESLKYGKAVCNGYAQLMVMFCHFAGIQCSYIDGEANGGRHAWNIVKIDGTYTLVDTTWDDKGSSPAYRWFGISTAEMNKSHKPDPEYRVLPSCSNVQGSTVISDWHTVSFDYTNLAFSVKLKDDGEVIYRINQRLIDLGYMSGSPYHAFNEDTKNAVREFQRKNAIHGNSGSLGVCSRLTQAALFGAAARGNYEDAPVPSNSIYDDPFWIMKSDNNRVKRNGSNLKLTFTLKNNNKDQPITAFTLRYWADDKYGSLVYVARETSLTSVNLGPSQSKEYTFDLGTDPALKRAGIVKWNIIEVAYGNGEIYINENISGVDAYAIRTFNETVY